MYFPALLGARFLGQPRAFIPAVAAILIPVDFLGETENQFTRLLSHFLRAWLFMYETWIVQSKKKMKYGGGVVLLVSSCN